MKIGWDYVVICIDMQSIMVLVEKPFHYGASISHSPCHARGRGRFLAKSMCLDFLYILSDIPNMSCAPIPLRHL
jgi:hypothetical protein